MKFVIADNSLTSYMGHSYEYARALQVCLRQQGHVVPVLAHQDVDERIRIELGALPCFRYGLDHQYGYLRALGTRPQAEWDFICHDRTYAQDLARVTADLKLRSEDLVLFHTIRHNHIRPIVRWLEQFSSQQRPRVALILRFTAYPRYDQPSPTARFYQRALAYLEASRVRSSVFLFTDSASLQAEYQLYTQLPLVVLPIPHAWHGEAVPGGLTAPAAKPGVGLTYLGDARLNKGFHLLPPLFRNLRTPPASGMVHGRAQANIRNGGEWQMALAARQLKELGVDLINQPLTSSAYYQLLAQSDVVLLPYTLDYYHSQTSGIFSEAVAYAKPVVVTRGSWMAQQISGTGAGVVFLPEDSRSLTGAVVEMVDDLPHLRQGAVELGHRWRKYHTPENFIVELLHVVNGQARQ